MVAPVILHPLSVVDTPLTDKEKALGTPEKPGLSGLRVPSFEAILKSGGVAIGVMPHRDIEQLRQMYDLADGIVFSGGNDVHPKHFGQDFHEKSGKPDEDRDFAELQFFEWARCDAKPIFALCRGMQILNVSEGGSLIIDIPSMHQSDTRIEHRQPHRWDKEVHTVRIERDSLLARLTNLEVMGVNSLHHQAIDRLGSNLRVTARADDGIVEAVEGTRKGHFVFGVQWHPELAFEQLKSVYARFIEVCKDWRTRAR